MTRHLILAAMLAACTPVPDRMDCTDPTRDWRDGCTVARDDAQRAATETPATERPETPEGPGTEQPEPEKPEIEPEEPERPSQNPGNDKDVGHAPFDGERGEEPSGRE